MNSNTVLVWILGIVVILGGGYFVYQNSTGGLNGAATSTVATTTTNGTGGSTNTGSGTGTGTTNADVPTVQTNAGATPSNSTAVVTGKVTPNGAPTSYWYEYGKTTAFGSRTTAQAIGSGYTAIPTPGYITGLSANTTYYFRLVAQNAYGTVQGAAYSFSTNNNPPAPSNPPQASTNAATSIARTSATLNAHVNPRGSQTTYWFEYGTTANFGSVSSFEPAGAGSASAAVSASLTGLNPQTKYWFRINAQNQYGTVNGATQSFTTSGPSSPGVPTVDTTTATDVATSTATFNGTIGANGAQTTYWFEYGQDSLLGQILGTVTASQDVSADATAISVSADATNLANQTKYYYRLVARNSFGTVRGDVVTFTTRR